ncbi:hypothetical protein ACFWBF_35905 [Streptomyces sp. NPDC060028]|uniref:hypothetical protein n=1 Tax=Streptomyces sp. NPDC060028 TaxID=3347041 RepID=UPI0036B15E16
MTAHRPAVQEHRPTSPTSPTTGPRSGDPTPGPRSTGPDNASDDRRTPVRDADTMAVISFLSGLVGLLAMNLVLGPIAIVLAGLALVRGTTRPGRARLGLALGIADLVVLACLVSADDTWSWSLG